MGFALRMAQAGLKLENAKPLLGFGGAGVQEIVDSSDSNAYRVVYAVQLRHGIFVLHCFQKKSVRGIKTPQPDKALIEERLRRARLIDAEMDTR